MTYCLTEGQVDHWIIFWQLPHRQTEAKVLKAQINGCQRLTGVAMPEGGKVYRKVWASGHHRGDVSHRQGLLVDVSHRQGLLVDVSQ